MRTCIICGKEHTRRSKYCSISCYFKEYYKNNFYEINEKKKKYNKEHYIPKERHILTLEEKKQKKKDYKELHKEELKQWHHEYYLKIKNDPEYRKKVREAQKRYFAKKKAERGIKNDKSE